jgi:hypothetical protein
MEPTSPRHERGHQPLVGAKAGRDDVAGPHAPNRRWKLAESRAEIRLEAIVDCRALPSSR